MHKEYSNPDIDPDIDPCQGLLPICVTFNILMNIIIFNTQRILQP